MSHAARVASAMILAAAGHEDDFMTRVAAESASGIRQLYADRYFWCSISGC
ncbi:hypothetical protein N5V81_13755 [Escherichia coli]|nr:hypothetical protein [Escherichia coli]